MSGAYFHLDLKCGVRVLRLESGNERNLLSRAGVMALQAVFQDLQCEGQPLVLTGNEKFFSAGADLGEIVALNGPSAYEFSKMGQELMRAVDEFPAPVYAAVSGYCMGGGLDLALACHRRIAAPNAVFGHRGAALGLITGWGGTQRLPRLVGKGLALQMFVAAEKVSANAALAMGLVNAVADDPVAEALHAIHALATAEPSVACRRGSGIP
jgi:enoyl-CoA hydratase/carnithine racemase